MTRATGTPVPFPRPADWTRDALCAQADPEIFFPDKGQPTRDAKSICRRCPVRAECLEWALAHGEQGIWGGTSEHERRRLRKGTAA